MAFPFIAPTPLNKPIEYNFKRFFSAPAVINRANEAGGVIRPLHIPGSPIPSPLARDISPDQLLALRQKLVGTSPETAARTGNGAEIWLSWKRAWDLWNNHYIPGRENPQWIRREYERIRNEQIGENGFGSYFTDNGNVRTADKDDYDEDNLCGGFQAIKDFPKFKEPPPFDPEVGDDGIVWDDLVNNSVWMPRRAGEDILNIDVDFDQDEFWRNSQLERDRGVDCGRLPYPVGSQRSISGNTLIGMVYRCLDPS